MGVKPTRPNFKAFSFDGTSSRNYGVYITGQGVFNAPERNVEMVEIPGRDGAYALDKGNFNNIEVTYPASIVADSSADFADAVSDLRNFLCSKVGYCRLEDEYNPNEYRMAIYKSGLEVSHEGLQTGEFDITFECKPQRWLTSGETATAVADGGKMTNPTLFDAKPLLQLVGYGDISWNGQTISLYDNPVGQVTVYGGGGNTLSLTFTATIDDSLASVGDDITLATNGVSFAYVVSVNGGYGNTTKTLSNDKIAITNANQWISGGTYYINKTIAFNPTDNILFTYGTSSTISSTGTFTYDTYDYSIETNTVTLSLAYDGANTFTFSASFSLSQYFTEVASYRKITFKTITLDSSSVASGILSYIDLDVGEAYRDYSGTYVPINNLVSLPVKLPVLPPGETTINYDNTFTSVKFTPRWWKV